MSEPRIPTPEERRCVREFDFVVGQALSETFANYEFALDKLTWALKSMRCVFARDGLFCKAYPKNKKRWCERCTTLDMLGEET